MRIFLSVGHSVLKNGNITSANGIINEYQYCKQMTPIIADHLRRMGHEVNLVICPERQFSKSTDEKGYKIGIENAGNYDLSCEIHLNASDNASASGSEVYYRSNNGKTYAERVSANLSEVFRNRGAKKRDNLYMLNQTKAPAILVESFFCTSQEDCDKGANMDLVARKIAEGITGSSIQPATQPTQASNPYPNLAQGGNAHLYDLQGAYVLFGAQPITQNGLWDKMIEGHIMNTVIRMGSENDWDPICGWVQFRIGANPDNWFGPKTEQKVNEYRIAHGMPENGLIDASVIITILRECGVAV